MWQKTFEKTYPGVSKEKVWSAWADVNNWTKWDSDLELTKMSGVFTKGTSFTLKPRGGPTVSLQITECSPFVSFTDVTRFPLAQMHDRHELIETPTGLTIRNQIVVKGPLAWLWRKIVAEGVAAGVPKQTDALVRYAQSTCDGQA